MRYLSLLFVVLFAFASCKKADKTEAATGLGTAKEAMAAPETENKDVNVYLKEFDVLLNAYKDALEKKDTMMLNQLSMKYAELTKYGQEAAEKATGEDKEKMLTYIQKMSQEFKAISEGKK